MYISASGVTDWWTEAETAEIRRVVDVLIVEEELQVGVQDPDDPSRFLGPVRTPSIVLDHVLSHVASELHLCDAEGEDEGTVLIRRGADGDLFVDMRRPGPFTRA